MNVSQFRRLSLVAVGLVVVTVVVILRLVVFQVIQGPDWKSRATLEALVVDRPERGVIYDRHGAVLAVDRLDYRVAASPNLVLYPEELASELAPILEVRRSELLGLLTSDEQYVVLAPRIGSADAEAIRQIENDYGLQLDPLPRRFYPQDGLMCHVLGFVNFDGEGIVGIESYYQEELAGEAASAPVRISPLERQETVIAREGEDLVLTIDRALQFTVERHLREALVDHGAVGGQIIVLDPRSGAIRAMASLPCYSPNEFYSVPKEAMDNPFVSMIYEPGSVMKLVTMAAALDSGTVEPSSTYNDTGVIEVGGHITNNWDGGAYGVVDMTTLLARSLNVGAATIATWMGPEVFYDYLGRFTFGRPTGIDIGEEVGGLMPLPGSGDWHDSFIATNSYGQALGVTPLQMAVAVSALANDGNLMQPYVVEEFHYGDEVRRHEPHVLSNAISPETAKLMTAMATTAVAQEVPEAQVPGYTVAGKTGTAQIAEAFGYHPTDVIGSFVGWLPADDPEVLIFVKLDRPTSAPWGSLTAAPVFAKLAKELVVMMDIPPDEIRLRPEIVAARGGGE